MRKWMIFTLVLLVFSGCAAPAPVEEELLPAAPEEVCSLPETWDLEPLSAPGIVTEGRAPSVGSTIQFEVFPEERRVRFLGGVDVRPTWYIADLSADVAYQDGTFTLSNFHLYGNEFFEERRP